MTRKPIHRFLPLTYKPKIPGVLAGTINQSIRFDTDLQEGDFIRFHGWDGIPYRSKWSFRTPYLQLTTAMPVNIRKNDSFYFPETEEKYSQPSEFLNNLAAQDGIDPPTTEELIRVLRAMHGGGTLHGKILRWDPKPFLEKKKLALVDPLQVLTVLPHQDFIQIGDIEKQRRDNPAILQ